MIRNIVFDMGRVLFDYNPQVYLARFFDNEADRAILLHEMFQSVAWVSYDRGAIDDAGLLAAVLPKLPERLRARATEMYHTWHHGIVPDEAMFAYADALQKRGYGVYLLSNAGRNFATFRKHMPGLEHFDGLFMSYEWGMIKPDFAIYRAFCGHFQLKASECLFIDDNPLNIEAAILCGWQGVVYHGDVGKLQGQVEGMLV